MKMYEVDQRIAELFAKLEPDEETGEILCDYEDVLAEIDALQGERTEKLQSMAMMYFEAKAEAEALKAEKLRIAKLQAEAENRHKRILASLSFFCNGEKTDLGIAKVSYRRTTALEVEDATQSAEWLEQNGYVDYVTYAAPQISKTDVKRLMAGGTEVPGCKLVESQSCSIK